jgi:hypothetical protein
MYAAFLGISEAPVPQGEFTTERDFAGLNLHMAIFRQPLGSPFFESLLSVIEASVFGGYPSNPGRRSIELHYSMKSVFHATEKPQTP